MALTYEQTKESFEDALRLFYRALELDPSFSTPWGMAARCYTIRKAQGWTVDADRERAEVRRLAHRVSLMGGDDALALCWAGVALAFVCLDMDEGAAMVDRALAINPNLAMCWINRAALSMYRGEHEAAREQISRSFHLSPLDPETPRSEGLMAAILLYQGKYEECLRWTARTLGRWPDWTMSMRVAAAAHALAGNLDEARSMMTRAREIDPTLRLSRIAETTPMRRPRDRNRLLTGLRLAGFPE